MTRKNDKLFSSFMVLRCKGAWRIAMARLIIAGVALSMWKGISLIPIIIVALVMLIVRGILLLYFWGKSYMARR